MFFMMFLIHSETAKREPFSRGFVGSGFRVHEAN